MGRSRRTAPEAPRQGRFDLKKYNILSAAACGALALGASPVTLAQHQSPGAYADLAWRMIGPMRGGRTRAVAGVPSQPNVFYVGAVNGGVWKTRDAGRTWEPIFDSQ